MNNKISGVEKSGAISHVMQLNQYESVLDSIFRAAPMGIGVVIDRKFAAVNEHYCDMLGYACEELIGRETQFTFADDQDQEIIGQEIVRQIMEKGVGSLETKLKRKDGEVINVLFTSTPLDPSDLKKGITFTAMDITSRVQSEKDFHDFVNNSQQGWAILTQNEVAFVNPTVAEMLRYPVEELLGLTPQEFIRKFVYPEDLDTISSQLNSRLSGLPVPITFELQVERGDGEIGWAEIAVFQTQYRNQLAYQYSILDITEQKESEIASQQSEEKYRTLFENVPIGLYRTTPEGQILEANQVLVEMLGYDDKSSLMAANSKDHYLDPAAREDLLRRAEQGESIITTEVQLRRKDDHVIWVQDTNRVTLADDGSIKYLEGNLIDISTRKKLEMDMLMTQFTVDHASIAIFWVGRDASIFYVNDAAVQTLGYTRDELLHMKVYDFNPDFPQHAWEEHWEEIKQKGLLNIESHNRTKCGKVIPVEVTINYIEYKGREYHCAFARDITSRKRSEEAIRTQLDRLHALHLIDTVISSSLDIDQTTRVILEQALQLLDVDAADILLFDPVMQQLTCAARLGFRTGALEHTLLAIGEGLAGQVAMKRERTLINDLDQQPQLFGGSSQLHSEGFKTYIGLPLIAKGELKGILEIFDHQSLTPDTNWLQFLDTLAGQAAIAIDNASLYSDLQRKNFELALAYDHTIEGWAKALEMRDFETEGHSQRVTDTCMRLAQAMGIPREDMVHVKRGALLHDIGKMAIPDDILHNPDDLDDEEWRLMKQHPVYAFQWLSEIPYLSKALDIPYCHHERWDGTGYPRGLKGEDIPLSARIFAIVDVWDALMSDRPYRGAWTKKQTLNHIKKQSGKHFDPKVVDKFIEVIEDIDP